MVKYWCILFIKYKKMNKKIASEIAIGIILLLAIFVGLLFWMQGENGNNMTAIPDNISPQKESSINNQ